MARASGSPRSRAELPTTSAEIAVGNLESQLEAMVRMVESAPSPASTAALASLYLSHGRLLGRMADLERADVLTERAVQQRRDAPSVLLARAAALAAFHRFDEAGKLLDEAARRGAEPERVDTVRAGILEALGRYAEARPIRERRVAHFANVETLGALAALDGDEGRLDDAERHFAEALDHFRDVSPLPLGWLWLQQGTMWQREGRPARARELLEAAHDRLPQLAPAAGHLAALDADEGRLLEAEALLRPLVDGGQSDDPEYVGQLATVLRARGRKAEGDQLAARARERFEALLAAHPAACADHAARFYLGPGRDAGRALELAERNFAARPTAEAAQLVAQAALTAGKADRACDAAEAMMKAAPHSVALHHAAWKFFWACHRTDRAEAALKRAEAIGREEPSPARLH